MRHVLVLIVLLGFTACNASQEVVDNGDAFTTCTEDFMDSYEGNATTDRLDDFEYVDYVFNLAVEHCEGE